LVDVAAETREDAIEAFSTRPLEAALQARVDELQARAERLTEALEFVLFNMDEEHPEDIGTVRAHVKNALREAPDD